MAEDRPEATDGVPAGGRTGSAAHRRGVRRRHVVMAAGLVAAASMTLWIVAAARAVDAYGEVAGPAVDCPPRAVEDDLEALQQELASLPDEGHLAIVARAFRSHFSQDRWSFEAADQRLSRDGGILHRRDSDGWEAIRRGSDAMARIDGSRFWVPDCANIRIFLMLDVGKGQQVGCIGQDVGAEVRTIWVAGGEGGGCSGGIRYDVRTSAEGALLQWTVGTATYRVAEPESVGRPAVHWRVPSFLASRR